ncbi:hypothetical protein BH23ACT6_BH23ACT6_26310 [soil metagenome]
MTAMHDHDLLLRHAVAWAEDKRKTLDRDLLESVVDLRDFHDESAPQAWPPGSVEHLMLVRWPSHGPSDVPNPDDLVHTLDTFWRFLRATGRMAASSADVKSLTKEARRAAPRMEQACADPTRHGANKSLIEFGESIGISLDGAASVEDLNERLQRTVQAWNELPEATRHELMPADSAAQGSLPGQSATALVAQARQQGLLDDAGHGGRWHREGEFAEDGGGVLDDEALPNADPAVVAEQVRASPFVQQCLRLAAWVGERGRPITPKGVMRLAPARDAYLELNLWEWEKGDSAFLVSSRSQDLSFEQERTRAEAAAHGFRSAADCRTLDRLWLASEAAGLIDLGKTKAYQNVPRCQPDSDMDWVHLGLTALSALVLSLPSSFSTKFIVRALLPMAYPGSQTVDVREIHQWWWDQPSNFYSRWEDSFGGNARAESDDMASRGLHEMEDTRVWRREGDLLHSTEFGYEFAHILMSFLDDGTLET